MTKDSSKPARTALMIHGAGGGGWEFAVWARVFEAQGWRVMAPDLRAGASGLAATRFADYEAQLRTCCEVLSPNMIVGASLGGLLALRIANACSAARLVLINPLPPAGLRNVAVLARSYPPIVDWRRRAQLISTAVALPDADASTWQSSWPRWRDESGAAMNEAALGIPVEIPQAKCLVVISGLDRDVPPATSCRLAEALSADAIELPTASHVGPLLGRDAAQIADRVLAWNFLRS